MWLQIQAGRILHQIKSTLKKKSIFITANNILILLYIFFLSFEKGAGLVLNKCDTSTCDTQGIDNCVNSVIPLCDKLTPSTSEAASLKKPLLPTFSSIWQPHIISPLRSRKYLSGRLKKSIICAFLPKIQTRNLSDKLVSWFTCFHGFHCSPVPIQVNIKVLRVIVL